MNLPHHPQFTLTSTLTRTLKLFLLLLLPFASIVAESEVVAPPPPPGQPPATGQWLKGYAIRYAVRLQDPDAALTERRTAQVALPTGGWLKPDASDIRVVDVEHRQVPAVVISHDPRGDTLLQFTLSGSNRWYWVYAVNPAATPMVDDKMRARMKQAFEASQRETIKNMELRTASAKVAGELRDARAALKRNQDTLARVDKEIGQLPETIATRQKAVADAQAALVPLPPLVDAAKAAHAAAEQKAAAAQKRVEAAKAAHAAAVKKTADAKAAAAKPAAPAPAATPPAALLAAAQTAEAQAAKALTDAEAAALAVRMELAGTKTKLDAQEELRNQAEGKFKQSQAALGNARSQLADARKLKQETEAEIGKLTPQVAALEAGAARASEQVTASSERSVKLQNAYREMALEADPRLHYEGMSLEVRDWGGDQLDELNDWPSVVAGLQRSDNILGNALLTDVLQKGNPFRQGDSLNFAASYRGYLDVKEPGLYRFVLNSDDAAFLFINDYLVYSRVGSNRPLAGSMNVFSVGADIELGTGVYPIEIHQVTGNTPGAVGRCAFYWITPGAASWSRVPSSAFKSSLSALAVRAEAPGGVRVPIPSMGVAGSLSCSGSDLFLARLEAGGAAPNQKVVWDFGDGQNGTGARIEHLYFTPGDHEVAMTAHPGLPPFRRRLHVWPAPVATSPLALVDAVRALERIDLAQLDVSRLSQAFAFLRICGQPDRWPLVEKVAVRLLREPLRDGQYRIQLSTAQMEAMARQGRAADALETGAKALDGVGDIRSLRIAVQMAMASIHYRHMQDYDTAARIYSGIVEENRRFGLGAVREAAIAWGDMYLDMGDTARAAATYRQAEGLGSRDGRLSSVADISRRGGLLRTAEKLLRDGDIRQSRLILERIEQDYPEQKVEGLFRFIRAEADRNAGFYDEAIRNYEVVLKLQQWTGYHSQAMLGLADASYRNGDHENALKWLDVVRESDPAIFEERKVEPFREVVAAALKTRQDGISTAGAAGIEFHAADAAWSGSVPPILDMAIPGISTGAVTFARLPTQLRFHAAFVVPHLVSEGAYWFEFWFRNSFTDSHAISIPTMNVRLEGTALPEQEIRVTRTFGLDFMGATLLTAPVADHGQLTLRFDYWHGLQQLHGLRLRPVTARQQEALLNFMEGRDTP